MEGTEISHIVPAPTRAQPLLMSTLAPDWYICYNPRTYTDTSSAPQVHSSRSGSLSVLPSTGLDRCATTVSTTDTCSIVWRAVSQPYKSSVLCLVAPPCPRLLAATDLFPVACRLAFSKTSCSWNRTVCSVAFSHWFLSLSHMHVSFLHLFPWLKSSFLLSPA